VQPTGTVIPNIKTSCKPFNESSQAWYWEGNVQSALIKHLCNIDFSIRSVANTASKAPGKDIIAITPENKELWISV